MPALHLRAELRLQGHLRLQSAGPPLNKPYASPAVRSLPLWLRTHLRKDIAMRMLFIMGGSLVLALGLRLIDPPVASAAPACSQPAASH